MNAACHKPMMALLTVGFVSVLLFGWAGTAQAHWDVGVGVTLDQSPPPPPRCETMVPAPGAGYSWVPGHWVWNGYGWAWTGGYWVMAAPPPPPPPPAVVVTPYLGFGFTYHFGHGGHHGHWR